MPRIENILDHFRRRPAMYTGDNTLISIHHFLAGYSFALLLNEIPSDDDPLALPNEFHDWVAYRLHFYESTSGWCDMICKRTETDQEAIDRFFELLTEFKAREAHVVARLIGFKKTYKQSTIQRNDNGLLAESPLVTKVYPNSISLVTFTDDAGFFAYSDTSDSFPFEGYFGCDLLGTREMRGKSQKG